MSPNKKLRVAVIFGGPSSEREVSLSSGHEVLKNLPRDKYELQPVEIKENGQWILGEAKYLGRQKSSNQLATFSPNKQPSLMSEFKNSVDVAFLALHGKFGEDGRIQSLLDILGIPYTGSGVLASALGMDKLKTRLLLSRFGIQFPKLIKVDDKKFNLEKLNNLIEQKISYPCVVKPNQSGSSIGVSIIDSKKQLQKAIRSASKEDSCVLIEEYIRGREMSCGVYGNTGQTQIKVLPVTEIIPKSSDRFFSYDAKYIPGRTREVCPAPISKKLTAEIQRLSKIAHVRLGCDGLTRSDFIIKENKVYPHTKRGSSISSQTNSKNPRSSVGVYFLEINTIPGITRTSICPTEAKVAGISFPKFLDLQIKLAIKKR